MLTIAGGIILAAAILIILMPLLLFAVGLVAGLAMRVVEYYSWHDKDMLIVILLGIAYLIGAVLFGK